MKGTWVIIFLRAGKPIMILPQQRCFLNTFGYVIVATNDMYYPALISDVGKFMRWAVFREEPIVLPYYEGKRALLLTGARPEIFREHCAKWPLK